MKISFFFAYCMLSISCFLKCFAESSQDHLRFLLETPETYQEKETQKFQEKESHVVISENDIIFGIKKDLIKKFPEISESLEITLVSPWKNFKISHTNWELKIQSMSSDNLQKNLYIRFKIDANNKNLGSFETYVQCKIIKSVWVSKVNIDRNTKLSEDLFSLELVDTLNIKGIPVGKEFAFNKYEIKRFLKAGQILTEQDLQITFLIKKGDLVEIFGERGLLKISMRGIAMENGSENDTISLQNIQTKKTIQGQVIGEKKARVYF